MRPIVLHSRHIPVVTLRGRVRMIFWLFRRAIPRARRSCALLSLIAAPGGGGGAERGIRTPVLVKAWD